MGCKWSLELLSILRSGISRPGAMKRSVAGLTAKVLNERLRKLTRYGIVLRVPFPEVPPRVEYHLTPFGRKFVALLDAIDRLEAESPKSAPGSTNPGSTTIADPVSPTGASDASRTAVRGKPPMDSSDRSVASRPSSARTP